MKKSILTALAIVLTVLAFAQNIPANMLKGIEVKTDEFTGATTYSAQNCCLSITRTKDDATMYISLSCASVDVPVKLKSLLFSPTAKQQPLTVMIFSPYERCR